MEVPVKTAPEENEAPTTASSAPAAPAPQATDTPTPALVAPEAKPATASAPVMDVRPPQAGAPAAEQPKPADAPQQAPDEKPKKPEKAKDEKPPTPVVPKKPRQPGVGAAIFASVVIVLGLAALAVYAYLKTQH
jgi:uncharacterized surface anchored protein